MLCVSFYVWNGLTMSLVTSGDGNHPKQRDISFFGNKTEYQGSQSFLYVTPLAICTLKSSVGVRYSFECTCTVATGPVQWDQRRTRLWATPNQSLSPFLVFRLPAPQLVSKSLTLAWTGADQRTQYAPMRGKLLWVMFSRNSRRSRNRSRRNR